MDCSSIFEDYISNCQDVLSVFANLTPSVIYKWVITAPNGAEYSGELEAGADGSLQIDVTDLPPGLLNQYAGKFILQIFDSPYQCRKVNFNMAGSYDAIAFTVSPGTNPKTSLGCEI